MKNAQVNLNSLTKTKASSEQVEACQQMSFDAKCFAKKHAKVNEN